MSGISLTVPISCPRDGCTLGTVYARLRKSATLQHVYYAHQTEDICSTGHDLTDAEWRQASDEADEVAKQWSEQTVTGGMRS